MTDTQFTGSGTDDRLRAELEGMANTLAARTTMPFVVPVKEILAAIHKVFADVPRIPNYDPELALHERPSWSNSVRFSLTELPEAIQSIRPWYDPTKGEIGIMLDHGDESCSEIMLESQAAKEFFLAGLAAVLHAERQ